MQIKKTLIILSISLTFFSYSQKIIVNSIGLNLGTTGFGLHLKNEFTERLNIRANLNYFYFRNSSNYESSGIRIDKSTKINSGTLGLNIDWKFLSKFDYIWLCAGLYYHYNKFYEKRSFQSIHQNDDLGNLQIELKTFPIKPYFGILIGKHNPYRRFNPYLEIGTLVHPSPKVNFTGQGKVEKTAEQDELIEQNIKNYYLFPIINFHLNYKIK